MEETQERKIVVYQVLPVSSAIPPINKPPGNHRREWRWKIQRLYRQSAGLHPRLGVTHIWYTGVPPPRRDPRLHGLRYLPTTRRGQSRPARPYAVKDYYNVNPDLAEDPPVA